MITLTPQQLSCEYLDRPLGIDTLRPRLGWKLYSEQYRQYQTAFQLIVADSLSTLEKNLGDLWDTGKVPSDQSVQILYDGKTLHSLARYYWKVKVWDKDGRPSEFSEPSWWEMGLLSEEDWKADWIGFDQTLALREHSFAPLFRKQFTLNRKVKRARACVCGLGYYELYINGRRIGDHVLDPAQTDYENRIFYITYDITDSVKLDTNAVGLILGNGWYNQALVWEPELYGLVAYGLPRGICQIHVEYEDGGYDLIVSDQTWKAAKGPILENNIYSGETYDARLEIPDWSKAEFDDRSWNQAVAVEDPGGKLVSQTLPPIKKIRTLRPVGMSEPRPGIFILDFGQNFSGWCRLKVNAARGTKITMRFSEEIDRTGMIDPASTGVEVTHVVQTDVYIAKGEGLEIWEPRFTYHGFRYVEITGFPGTPTLDNVKGVLVHSAVEPAGTFECSDPMFNRLHRTAQWTQISNLHGIPTDCPTRERCGWLGDAQVAAEMAIYNFNMPNFWAKYVADIATSTDEDGIPNMVVPGKRSCGKAVPLWGSAVVQLPWYLYLYYGDTRVMADHYPGMKTWVEHLLRISNDLIVKDCLGDWCPPGSVEPVETPIPLTATAYFYYNVILLSQMAACLHIKGDSETFNRLAERIKDAFIRTFYDPISATYGSQTADALVLYLGLFPSGERTKIARSLARDVMEKHRGHHSTGIVGSRYLYSQLAENGQDQVAWTLLHQTEYPSFGYLFSKGATTFWECWREQEVHGRWGLRSRSHPMQGGFDAWFFQTVAGINPDPEFPGFKHIIIRPVFVGDLTFAKATYHSMYGEIASEWMKEKDKFALNVSIPPNTTATIFVPGQEDENLAQSGAGVVFLRREQGYDIYRVDSGKYSFTATKCGEQTGMAEFIPGLIRSTEPSLR